VLHWTLRGTNLGEMQLSNRTSGTDLAFMGGGSAANANIFGLPRIGFDALWGSFTAGGSLIYLRSATNIGNGDALLVSPRLGALFPKSSAVRAWLRGGVSFASLSSDITGISSSGGVVDLGQTTVTLFDLTLEPMALFMASKQVAITLGASVDIGLAGSATLDGTGSESRGAGDFTASSYGASAGIVAIF
jgi:hypothetical protein